MILVSFLLVKVLKNVKIVNVLIVKILCTNDPSTFP